MFGRLKTIFCLLLVSVMVVGCRPAYAADPWIEPDPMPPFIVKGNLIDITDGIKKSAFTTATYNSDPIYRDVSDTEDTNVILLAAAPKQPVKRIFNGRKVIYNKIEEEGSSSVLKVGVVGILTVVGAVLVYCLATQ